MSDDSVPKGPVENPRWIERRCTCHSAEEWEGNDWENLHPGPGGKGNTPREHIFQPGHKKSKGPRKKKDNGIASLFKAEADKVIAVKRGGKSAKLTQAEYIVTQYWQDAMKGIGKARKEVMELTLKLFPPPEAEGEEGKLSDAELNAIKNMLAWKSLISGEGEDD